MQQDTAVKGLRYNQHLLKRAFNAALYPCMLSILSNCTTIIADGIIVGRKIGTDGLTAISLCVPVYLVLCVLGSLFVSGALAGITAQPRSGITDTRCSCAFCLLLLAAAGGPLWLFLPVGEFLTVGASYVAADIIRRKNQDLSRILLIDTGLDKSNNLLLFSVTGNVGEISGACEKVTRFCVRNGMPPKQAARISLSLEEVMALISQKNDRKPIRFDKILLWKV